MMAQIWSHKLKIKKNGIYFNKTQYYANFWGIPISFSSYKTILKQQLNDENWWDVGWCSSAFGWPVSVVFCFCFVLFCFLCWFISLEECYSCFRFLFLFFSWCRTELVHWGGRGPRQSVSELKCWDLNTRDIAARLITRQCAIRLL